VYLLQRLNGIGKMLQRMEHADLADRAGFERPGKDPQVVHDIDTRNLGTVDIDPSLEDVTATAQM
jgi:hypothetical protein